MQERKREREKERKREGERERERERERDEGREDVNKRRGRGGEEEGGGRKHEEGGTSGEQEKLIEKREREREMERDREEEKRTDLSSSFGRFRSTLFPGGKEPRWRTENMGKSALKTTEKCGETVGKHLPKWKTAPKKLPPPIRKTDLQVCAPADNISKLVTKRGEKGGRQRKREGEREESLQERERR